MRTAKISFVRSSQIWHNVRIVGIMTLGERLKKAREDADLSLKKFAEISKIQVKYLERLEKGEYEKLPAPVYTQGFLKKYAQILELAEQELLDDYKKELEAIMISGSKQLKSLPALPSPKIVVTPKMLSLVILGLVILIIVGDLAYQVDYLIAPPQLSLEYPSADITMSQSSIKIFGSADPSAKLTVNGQQVYIDKDGKFSQEINLSPGVNTLKIEAVNRFGKKSEIIRQIIVK